MTRWKPLNITPKTMVCLPWHDEIQHGSPMLVTFTGHARHRRKSWASEVTLQHYSSVHDRCRCALDSAGRNCLPDRISIMAMLDSSCRLPVSSRTAYYVAGTYAESQIEQFLSRMYTPSDPRLCPLRQHRP